MFSHIKKRITIMKYKLLVPGLLCLITSGCLFMSEPFKPVSYYDLGKTPEPAGLETHAIIDGVKTSGPYKSSMVFRLKPNELIINDYKKWAQTPEVLVKSYLTAYIGQSLRSGSDNATLVNTNILVFEAYCLAEKPEAVLTVEWTVTPPHDSGKSVRNLKSYRTEMKDNTPASFAEAMSASVAKFADDLLASIKTANKK